VTKQKSHQTDGDDAPGAHEPVAQTDDAGRAAEAAAGENRAGQPTAPETKPPESGAEGPAVSATAEERQAREAQQPLQLRAELAEAKDRALRYQAELDNYRKRAQRQIDDERRYANLPLLRDLLPVFDNVHRAIEAAEKSPEPASLLAGFKLVAQQLQDVLSRHHCEPIEALHAPFDPHLHQAVGQQPSEEHPANTVLSVAQAGFRLYDRVVRPSQVIVSATNRAKEKE